MFNLILNIISILLITAYPISVAWVDAEHYVRQQWVINHRSRFVSRGIVIAMIGAINPLLGVYGALIFWVLFDGFLSKLRGFLLGRVEDFKWFYIGSVSDTDILFAKYPKLYKPSKYIALVLCIIIIYTILK